jgi:hypothetical protein
MAGRGQGRFHSSFLLFSGSLTAIVFLVITSHVARAQGVGNELIFKSGFEDISNGFSGTKWRDNDGDGIRDPVTIIVLTVTGFRRS